MKIDYATPTFRLYGPETRGWYYPDPFDYSTLQWNVEGVEKPSQIELVELSVEMYYEKEVNEYKERRNYPSFEDQLDQIYHEGVDSWKASIQEIKDKYPKTPFDPEELARRKAEALDFIS